MGKRSYSIDEAAALLGVSRRTVYTYIKRGSLITVRVGTSARVTSESLEFCPHIEPRLRIKQNEPAGQ